MGGGTVGASVLTLLHRSEGLLAAMGVSVELLPVLVRDPAKPRAHEHPAATFTADPAAHAHADVVVEVMGGVESALDRLAPHLAAGRPVVTANKAVLAECWGELQPHAAAGRLYYEAAVMAGTPAVGPLATTLRASTPVELHAVLSGTCNHILSRMEAGADFGAALAEAQARGYAEDPPTLDVGGFDAAHKLTVLGRLAFDPDLALADVEVRGIDAMPDGAVLDALGRGARVRLVGSIVPDGARWRASVRPVELDSGHPLAALPAGRGGLLFRGEECGTVFLSGGGAGGSVTASAVVGDLLDLLAGRPGHTPRPVAARPPLGADGETLAEVRA